MTFITTQRQVILQSMHSNGLAGLKKDVTDYLQHQGRYAKHEPANTRFSTRKETKHSSHHQCQADLCDMRSILKGNDNINCIF